MALNRTIRSSIGAVRPAVPRYEIVVLMLILIFPFGGVFFPPETYFAPQDFTIDGVAAKEIGFPFARLVNIAILAWLFYLFYKYQKLMLHAVIRCWLPLTFVGWAMISAFFTADPVGSINRGVRMLIAVVLAAYVVERFGTRGMLKYFLLAGAVAIIASVFAVIAIPSYGLTTLLGYEGAWRGAMSHKNMLGGAMAVLIVQSYFALRSKSVNRRLGQFTLFGSLFVLFMAEARTSQIAAAINFIALFIFDFINRLRSRPEKAIALSVASLLLPAGIILQVNLDNVLILLGRSPSLTGRTDVWAIVWGQIQANPIWGYGNNFWATEGPLRNYMWAQLNWAAPHAHSMYLDVWFQLGIIGLVLAGAVFIVVLQRSLVLILMGIPFVELIWPASIVVILFQGFTETNLVEPAGNGWYSLTLAFASMSKVLDARKAHAIQASAIRDQHKAASRQKKPAW